MLIRLKKTRDGVVLSCIRGDGSAAVQRSGHGGYFAFHDLMHYAVETALGFRDAFLGLMDQGWDFATFADHDDPRYKAMPDEAIVAEHLVDIITRGIRESVWNDPDLLRLWTDEVNAELETALGRSGRTAVRVEPERLADICRVFRELVDRWAAVPVGEHMELVFPGSPAPKG